MEFKDFVDITLKAGCKITKSKTSVDKEYLVEYRDKIYARAEFYATDKDVSVTFRDSVLKWYQNIFFGNPYMEITSKSGYESKLAKVIKQNEN